MSKKNRRRLKAKKSDRVVGLSPLGWTTAAALLTSASVFALTSLSGPSATSAITKAPNQDGQYHIGMKQEFTGPVEDGQKMTVHIFKNDGTPVQNWMKEGEAFTGVIQTEYDDSGAPFKHLKVRANFKGENKYPTTVDLTFISTNPTLVAQPSEDGTYSMHNGFCLADVYDAVYAEGNPASAVPKNYRPVTKANFLNMKCRPTPK